VSPSLRPTRLLLALKAAIAAGLAWPAAQLLPGSVDEYSYYAPLGALISMMPTLMGSLRASLQTTIGLALGIGLAWAVLETPLPARFSVPIAVGIGVVLGGLRGLGAGRDYVPIAALFVLVIGGSQAGDYSLGYLIQMGVGMAIGVLVNLVIVPPLYLRDSAAEIGALRTAVAATLNEIGSALTEPPSADHAAWLRRAGSLEDAIRSAEPVIEDAGESRRANPRARWHSYDMQEDFDDLQALARLASHTRDLGEVVSATLWSEPVAAVLPEHLRQRLRDSIDRVADLVLAWDSADGEEEALHRAEAAVGQLDDSGEQAAPGNVGPAATFTLQRMLVLVKARLRPLRR
jgi:hypothetical protein